MELNSASLLVAGNDIGVLCTATEDTTTVVRGKQLLRHLLKLFRLLRHRPVFVPEVRSAGSKESDSGDEDVPIDKAIPKVFDDWDNFYICSMASASSYGPEKLFMHHLGNLLAWCVQEDHTMLTRFESCHSTNVSGSGAAGSCIIKHVTWRRASRSMPKTSQSKRRFSDAST